MRGNIVFFFHYGESWWEKFLEWLVATKTHGPYVHVGFVIDKNPNTGKWRIISAQSNGINYSDLDEPLRDGKKQWRMATLRTMNQDNEGHVIPIDKERLTFALEWARMHLHVRYSMIDNMRQTMNILFPNNTFPTLTLPDRFNCSNFTVAFMDKAGIRLPRSFTYPFNTSPNDVAEWCGLLPWRKRIVV